jgi:hypothetical protein
MSNLREAIKSIIATADNRKMIHTFARSKFNEWNSKQKQIRVNQSTFCYYDGFVILSESKIEINYKQGEHH